MDGRVVFALIGIWSLISCTDHSSIIEGNEPDTLLLSKEDSLSFLTDSMALAQENLRDSLRNEGWYSFNSFAIVEEGKYLNYPFAILKPDYADSITSGDFILSLPAFVFHDETDGFFGASYPCYTDAPGPKCFKHYPLNDFPNNFNVVLDQNLDTAGIFEIDKIQNTTDSPEGIVLYLPSPNDSTFVMSYFISYSDSWKHTAWCIAYSAHRYK